MTFPTISTLPPAPQRTQTPDAFSLTADAFVAALPGFATEVNSAGDYFEERATSVGNVFKGTYVAGTTYVVGESVLYNAKYYISLVNSNTGNTPSSSPTQWSEIAGTPLPKEGTQEFIATGTIPTGAVVGLNADGTVSIVNAPFTNVTALPTSFTAFTSSLGTCYLKSSNKIVVSYSGGGNPYLVVGTISNKVITFGTPLATTYLVVALAASEVSETFVAIWNDTVAANTRAVAGTVSGTTITLGTASTTNFGTSGVKIKNNPVTDSFVVFSQPTAGITITPLSVSVRTITVSAGTVVTTFNPVGVTGPSDLVYDTTNNNFVFVYQQAATGFPIINFFSATGTTITLGSTPVVFLTTNIGPGSVFYDSVINKVIVWQATRVYVGRNIAGVITLGNAILKTGFTDLTEAFTTYIVGQGGLLFVGLPPVSANSWNTTVTELVYVIITPNEDNTITVSGETLFLGDSYLANSAVYAQPLLGSQVFLGLQYYITGSNAISMTLFDANHLYDSFIGVADYAVTNGQTVRVVVAGGINNGVTGLTRGSHYYLQNNGQLSKDFKRNRKIGVALSTTSLLVYGGGIEL